MAAKQRIDYIDLMKGIVIMLVLMIHFDIEFGNHIDDMLLYVRMPVYIFLSGLFYSNYSSFKELVIKKTNKYIIHSYSLVYLHWFYTVLHCLMQVFLSLKVMCII